MRLLLSILLLAILVTVSFAYDQSEIQDAVPQRRSSFILRPWRKGWDAFFGPERIPLPHGGWGWGRR